jgi:hypothetical protein
MKSKTDLKVEFLLEREETRAVKFFIALILSCATLFIGAIIGFIALSNIKMAIGEMDLWGFSLTMALILLMGIGLIAMYLEHVYKEMSIPLEMAKKGKPVKRNIWGHIEEDGDE